jgi:hypothetical protein
MTFEIFCALKRRARARLAGLPPAAPGQALGTRQYFVAFP